MKEHISDDIIQLTTTTCPADYFESPNVLDGGQMKSNDEQSLSAWMFYER